MSGWIILYAVAWACAFGALGSFIGGQTKGQPTLGFMLGFLLGPLGLLLIFAGKDDRPKCSQCKMAVPEGATKCGHCGANIAEVSQATIPEKRNELFIATQAKCPSCGSSLDGRYPKCRHCGENILWIACCPTGCGHAFLIEPSMHGETVACPKCKHNFGIDDSLPAKASTKVRAKADAKNLVAAMQVYIHSRNEKSLPCKVCHAANIFTPNQGSGVCESCKKAALRYERYDKLFTRSFVLIVVIVIFLFVFVVGAILSQRTVTPTG